jgi:hypothetical protein
MEYCRIGILCILYTVQFSSPCYDEMNKFLGFDVQILECHLMYKRQEGLGELYRQELCFTSTVPLVDYSTLVINQRLHSDK